MLVLLLVMAIGASSTPTAAPSPTAAALPTALPAAAVAPLAVRPATTKTVTDLAGRVVTIPFPRRGSLLRAQPTLRTSLSSASRTS